MIPFALTVTGEEENAIFRFFRNLWEFFYYDVYLNADQDYRNLGLDTGSMTSVRVIVLGIFLGAVIGCVYMTYNKQVLGSAVRKMLSEENGCRSKENAKMLSELGYAKNFLIKSAFANSVSLRRVIKCVEEEQFYLSQAERKAEYDKKRAEQGRSIPKFRELEYRIDAENDHFYIPEELCDMAEQKFRSKGFGWVATVIGILLICIGFFVVLLVLPKVLTYVDEFIGSFK